MEAPVAVRRVLLSTIKATDPLGTMNDTDTDSLKKQLDHLQLEHRDLDDVIDHLIETRPFDQLQIQRLKKRKLSLKDQIRALENQLLPDIIA